jgi:hypothetical protein
MIKFKRLAMDCPICKKPMELIETLADWTAKGVSQIWSDHYEDKRFSVLQILREDCAIWHCPKDFSVICATDPSINNLEMLLDKFNTQIKEARENLSILSSSADSTKSAVLRINFNDRPNLQMITIEGKLSNLIEISIVNAVEYKNARKRFLRRDLLNKMLQITDHTKLVRGDVYLLEENANGVVWAAKIS